MQKHFLFYLFLMCIGMNACSAQEDTAQRVVENTIESRMKFYKVPSVSVAVIRHGQVIWAKAYGMADETAQRPADSNTLYQVASMTKSVNAFCMMRLFQEGKLSLDTDIRPLLHSWKFPDNDLSKGVTITISNLLSHTAGLSVHGFKGYLHSEKIPVMNDILNGIPPANSGKVEAIFKPGTKLEYSGGGILITKKILEDNVAENYDSLLQQMVLSQLSMNNSSFSQPLDNKWKNFAAAYDEQGKEIAGKYYIYPEGSPDGLWTTASDYAKFIISIQHSIGGIQPALLNKEIVLKMLTPVLENSALGFFITAKGAQKYFGHSGANIGFRCAFSAGFTSGDGVVVLTNSDKGGNLVGEIVKAVADTYQWKFF